MGGEGRFWEDEAELPARTLERPWEARVYGNRWQSLGRRDPPTTTIESQWQNKVEKRKVK
jgi:hypothetical protein